MKTLFLGGKKSKVTPENILLILTFSLPNIFKNDEFFGSVFINLWKNSKVEQNLEKTHAKMIKKLKKPGNSS